MITEKEVKEEIDKLSHYQMAYLWRFAPVGHKYFDKTKPYYEYFNKRFYEFGGMTFAISKELGWDK